MKVYTNMKKKLVVISMLIFVIFISCTGSVNNKARFIGYPYTGRVTLPGKVMDFNTLTDGKAAIVSRIVQYINGYVNPLSKQRIELCFVDANLINDTGKRESKSVFYEAITDENGYFMIEMNRLPKALIYIYIAKTDHIYLVPSSALVNISPDNSIVYSGEIHLINLGDDEGNRYKLSNIFEFYNNMSAGLLYLESKYFIDKSDIDVVPFYVIGSFPTVGLD